MRQQFRRHQGALAFDGLEITRGGAAIDGGRSRCRGGLSHARQFAVEAGGFDPGFTAAATGMTRGPPTQPEARQHAQHQQRHHQQPERCHDDLRQRPQSKLHRLRVADGDQYAQQHEQKEETTGEDFHVGASITRRATLNRDAREKTYFFSAASAGNRPAARAASLLRRSRRSLPVLK